ncbi:MAG: LPP20 family lipoprotein [Myxococcota bacterium]
MKRYLLAMFLIGTCLYAQTDSKAQDQVIQKLSHGQVNWTNKVIVVTGSAAPNLKGGVVAAQVRLQTERAAELDAYRKILEIVKGVRVDSSWTVGDMMQSVPEVRTTVEGLIKGMKRIDTKYYSDGGVDVIVQVDLEGMMASTVAKEVVKKVSDKKEEDAQATKEKTDKKDIKPALESKKEEIRKEEPKGKGSQKEEQKVAQSDVTGVIINVKGHPYQPVMYPKILDDKNNELFAVEKADPNLLNEGKLVSYYLSENAAKNSERVKDKPVIINAVSVKNKSEIIIRSDDAKKINRELLRNGRLAIIVD